MLHSWIQGANLLGNNETTRLTLASRSEVEFLKGAGAESDPGERERVLLHEEDSTSSRRKDPTENNVACGTTVRRRRRAIETSRITALR